MNTYAAFYNGKQIQIESDTSYHAQQQAAKIFKCKEYKVTIILIAKDGKEVVHDPSELD